MAGGKRRLRRRTQISTEENGAQRHDSGSEMLALGGGSGGDGGGTTSRLARISQRRGGFSKCAEKEERMRRLARPFRILGVVAVVLLERGDGEAEGPAVGGV